MNENKCEQNIPPEACDLSLHVVVIYYAILFILFLLFRRTFYILQRILPRVPSSTSKKFNYFYKNNQRFNYLKNAH